VSISSSSAGGTVPTFAIVGAARAGSTAVIESLRAHPDAFVSLPKEPHYYAFAGRQVAFTGPGDDAAINRVALTRREDFSALFPQDDHRFAALGEGSVSSLYYHQRAIPQMLEVNPAMRVVILLRDPVDRAFSSYQYLRLRRVEPEDDFLAAVRDEKRRVAVGWHHLWHYIGMSSYAASVRAFLDGFPSEQVSVWWYDDLDRDAAGCLCEIAEFVGLDPLRMPVSQPARLNVSGRPRSPRLQSTIDWASTLGATRTGLKRIVPFRLRERIRSANLAPQGVTPEQRRTLAPCFAEDLMALQEALQRPVPWQ